MAEETELKTKLVSQCKRVGAYARRFEDRYAVGILDVLVAFNDMPVLFVEGKIIRAGSFGPTERQWIEGEKLLKLTGGFTLPVLVGWDIDKRMFVGEWSRKLRAAACFSQQDDWDYAITLWSYINDAQLKRRESARRSEKAGM